VAVVETEKQGEVAVIRMDNPPVNALGHALRVGLEKAFNEANADAGVKAIVLTGTGRFFSAGADITEFKAEMKEPYLPQLIDRIEASAKPVVAAVNGTALGGGLELSLGCHWRVAGKDVRQLGLPEIKLGIIPGAGGTQRLPRLIGFQRANEVLRAGRTISSREAVEWGLVSEEVDQDLVGRAVELARGLADGQVAAPALPREALPNPPESLPHVDLGHRSRAVDAILVAAILGFLFWQEIPDLYVWLGAAVVIGAGIYIFYRETALNKA